MMADFKVLTGNPERLGVVKKHGGYNFAVTVPDGVPAELLLYRQGTLKADQVILLPEKDRVGQVSAVFVEIPSGEKWEYNYRIGEKVVADPYAREVRTGPEEEKNDQKAALRCSLETVGAAKTRPLEIPYEECFLYKTHVRGFTRQKGSRVRHKGTFLGVKEKIPYLKTLGITTLLLMPVYEFETLPSEDREQPVDAAIGERQKMQLRENYWGYTNGLYFAPRRYYCATDQPAKEFAGLVDALHEAGIECLLEFYFDRELPVSVILDVLHYWRLNFQVDGFHLMGQGNWMQAVSEDPLLKKSKLIYHGLDAEQLYGEKKLPRCRNLAEMNPGYKNVMRRFLKGDDDCLEDAARYLRKNEEAYGSIVYFADQDGFTMADMVSYEKKHNGENGEGGRDGSDYNCSWNCGVEGPSRRLSVRKLRMQQLCNAVLMLFTSQGTPMIYGGDEFCNSQGGNNNAWCQDNETGWLDWGKTKEAEQMRHLVEQAAAFRKAHPILHRKMPMRLMDYHACGYPDLSYHSQRAWVFPEDGGHSLGVMFCGEYALKADGTADDSVYIAYNMHWESCSFALPDLKENRKWKVKADTGSSEVFYPDGAEKEIEESRDKSILVAPRTIMILIGKQE